jgi:alkylhydroperoxidase/carboxymuconolactone decarboxylase family protein YurZ
MVRISLCQQGTGLGGRRFEEGKGILFPSPHGQQIFHYAGIKRKEGKMPKKEFLPFSYKRLRKEFPEVEKEYDRLAKKCHASGPLNEKMRRLIKLGIAIGSESEGAIKSHARRALAIGVTPDEIRHAVLLGLTTIGFPKMIAALNWVHEAFEEGPLKHRRGD